MEERKELTKRQEEVLNYIKKYIAEHGYPPAVREICAGIGLNSPATVFVHIKKIQTFQYTSELFFFLISIRR